MIDPHVHFRDFMQKYKETIKHGLELAEEQGIEKVFDMPNTDPPILSGKDVQRSICHVSCPESVELIDKARKEIKITCGITPHHILWSDKMLSRPDGLLYKMNPPLRDKTDVAKLREYLRKGKIDWIETDHAPHSIGEKLFPPYLSGFPSLYLYKDFVENFLPTIGLTKKQIKNLTNGNICKTFKDKIN